MVCRLGFFGGSVFAVGPMGGLMPRWCGEAGGSPALSRNRDHHCVWESGYQITWGWCGVPSRVTGSASTRERLCCLWNPLGTFPWRDKMIEAATTKRRRVLGSLVVAAVVTGAVGVPVPALAAGGPKPADYAA